MNLEKEMGDATFDQTGMLGWEDAIRIAHQYAESKCREQMKTNEGCTCNSYGQKCICTKCGGSIVGWGHDNNDTLTDADFGRQF